MLYMYEYILAANLSHTLILSHSSFVGLFGKSSYSKWMAIYKLSVIVY